MPEVGLDARTELCNLSSTFLLCTLTRSSTEEVDALPLTSQVVSCTVSHPSISSL